MSGPTLEIPNRRVRPDELDPADRLFRHRVHPEWGVGVWIREERSRRRLRFEDGEMRVFKKGFYALLEPVDSDRVDVDEVFARVVGEHTEAQALDAVGAPPVLPFGRQLELFLEAFPGGFTGDRFAATWGEDASPRKNLPAAMAVARRLAATRVPGEAAELALETMGTTGLVTPRQVRGLAALAGADRIRLGEAIVALIHGEARFARRFTAWLEELEALGLQPGWRAVTAILALCRPDKHVLVRRRVFQLQGRSTMPCRLPAAPSLAGYRRARRVARRTRERLLEAGLKPRHMLDVHVFVWETLRPGTLKRAEVLHGA